MIPFDEGVKRGRELVRRTDLMEWRLCYLADQMEQLGCLEDFAREIGRTKRKVREDAKVWRAFPDQHARLFKEFKEMGWLTPTKQTERPT